MAAPVQRRRYDATSTRGLLLRAAGRRFSEDGYAATTVRDIARDAGVNVGLINRYFTSKEGLFEACLRAAVDRLRAEIGAVSDLDEVAAAFARRGAETTPDGPPDRALLLLLRSSGDETAERLRRGVLRSASETLAGIAGWGPDDDEGLLRAQLVLAAGLGLTILRRSLRLEPAAVATEDDLLGPLHDLVDAVLRTKDGPSTA